MTKTRAWTPYLSVAGAALALAACSEPAELAMPTADEVEVYYDYQGTLAAEINGNVVVVTVSQSAQQLRRGGTLWAKVGPYIVLFTDETRRLMDDFPGVAGVRVVTRVGGGPEVARALLVRDELSDVLWRRSLNIGGQARRDGTERPSLLDDLVRWGEQHTEYEYNARYTRR